MSRYVGVGMYVLAEIAGQITSHTVWYVCIRDCNYSASLHPAGTGLAFIFFQCLMMHKDFLFMPLRSIFVVLE